MENSDKILDERKEYLKHLCQTDRLWWNSETKELQGDMGWSFEDMPETKTFDARYAESVAVNCIATTSDSIDEYSHPVFLLIEMIPGNENVFKVITSVPETDTDFVEEIKKRYPEADINHVPADQEYIELWEDTSMDEYNKNTDNILVLAGEMMSNVSRNTFQENEIISFPPIEIHGLKVTGISRHLGLDLFEYYNLYTEGNPITPGMQEYRVEEFFTRIRPDEQDGIIKGLAEAVRQTAKYNRLYYVTEKVAGGMILKETITGKIIGDKVFEEVKPMSDGWALIKNKDGIHPYNFINTKGEYLSKDGLDMAMGFKDGIATGIKGNELYVFNKIGQITNKQVIRQSETNTQGNIIKK